MSIVLEGCDRTGKTTVINVLQQYLKEKTGNEWQYHYFSNPRKIAPNIHPFDYFYNVYHNMSRHSILSRCHISNDVYGQIFNKHQDLTDEQFQELDQLLLASKPLIIVMSDDAESISSRWNNEEMFPVEKVQDILQGYYHYIEGAGKSKINCVEASLPQFIIPQLKDGLASHQPSETLIDLLEQNINDCKIGWANPSPYTTKSKFHYFDSSNMSLCHKWAVGMIKTFELGNDTHIDNCAVCKRKKGKQQ